MQAQTTPLTDLLCTELQAHVPAAHFAFIFGSRAQGREHPTSDLDLAVFCGRPLTPDERLEWSSALEQKFKMKVDLVDLMTCGPTVEFEIARGGKLLFSGNPDSYAEWMRRYLFDQADWAPLRQRAVQARIKAGLGK